MKYGTLTIITGPMFSGKTTELLRLYDRKIHAKVPCLLVTHACDTRYSKNHVTTHTNKFDLHTKGQAVSYDTIMSLIKGEGLFANKTIDTVFIDEIQFFTDMYLCLDLLNIGINVVVTGLNGDYRRNMFPGMDRLFSSASEITMLTAICSKCQKEAAFTAKHKSVSKLSVIDVGGSDKYMPVCLHCWSSMHQQIK